MAHSDAIEKLLLVAIAESASDVGYSWPGLEKLARRSCRTRRHVIRLLRGLEVRGWLESNQRAAGFGNKQTAYQLNVARLKAPFLGGTQIAPRISVPGDICPYPRWHFDSTYIEEP
jgi:hypothetical protein